MAAPLALVAIVLVALGSVLARRSGGSSAFGVNSSGSFGTVARAGPSDFSLPLYDGSTLRMGDLAGRAVVMNFWASWCVPCKDEAPLLARVAQEYEPRGVTFIGVNVWDAESDAKAFVARYGVGYPNGSDIGGKISIDYGLTGIPETFFIRADGAIARRWIGPLPEGQLRTLVEEIRPGARPADASEGHGA
jgi:cytochrome c biogenesis protein CcmG/thiol:disulfide interchange protein DsbE